MEERDLEKLGRGGALAKTRSGRDGVRVSLQLQDPISTKGRSARRQTLIERFTEIRKEHSSEDVEVDLESISVSAQTVTAVLPVDTYEDLTRRLGQDGVRVDPILKRQVIQPF